MSEHSGNFSKVLNQERVLKQLIPTIPVKISCLSVHTWDKTGGIWAIWLHAGVLWWLFPEPSGSYKFSVNWWKVWDQVCCKSPDLGVWRKGPPEGTQVACSWWASSISPVPAPLSPMPLAWVFATESLFTLANLIPNLHLLFFFFFSWEKVIET